MINGLLVLLDIAKGKRQKSDYNQPTIVENPDVVEAPLNAPEENGEK
jgi:hypothetical protein